ncbi:hypothetical protein F5I97DRAFT_1801888 [Phlebopus sp. FC_14]|nr:hypothetical protein F5I97DRAFT_1801888 [Phlebopus sp. FC_14]
MYHLATPQALAAPNAARRNRLRRGQLHLLPSVPLDIVHEILCFLWPGDLLALSRTSKAFRSLLMSRSAAFLWTAARQNAGGLPEPPSDVNEIQYAALAFGTECSNQVDIIPPVLVVIELPAIRSGIYASVCAEVAGLNTSERHFHGLTHLPKGNPTEGFHTSQLKAFRQGLQTVSASERDVYLARLRQETEAITKHTGLVVKWQLQVRRERHDQLNDMRIARMNMIRDLLVKAGFSEEIQHFTWERISRHHLIKSSQELTEQGMISSSSFLQEYMSCWRELLREERVYSARRVVFTEAWFQFASAVFFNAPPECPYLPLPPTSSIGFSPPIDSVIRQPGHVPPENLLAQLHRGFEPACDYILQWHRGVRRELASLLPDYKLDDDDEKLHTRLNLAISVFRCTASKRCQLEARVLTYPEMLSHPCFSHPLFSRRPKDPLGHANRQACIAMGGPSWNWQGLVRPHHKREAVVNIVTCCGKDPKITTIADMDVEDPRVMCMLCLNSGVIIFMNWRVAVSPSLIFWLRLSSMSHRCSTALKGIRSKRGQTVGFRRLQPFLPVYAS